MASNQWSDRDFGALPSVVVAAHELKAPLALIRQMSLLLKDSPLEVEELDQVASQITRTTEQALSLVNDLSWTANLSPTLFPMEPVNPLAVCEHTSQEMRPALEMYNRQIDWPNHQSRNQLVLANHTLLARVLANFLENAIRYSDSCAKIKVSVGRMNETIRLGVRDYGPMISLEEYRRLTSEISLRKTVRTRPESSGLGIYVASQFAQAMNGEIGLTRHRDGLTFFVDLPMSKQMSWL